MATSPGTANLPAGGGITPEERKVIFASSLGTIFEWYDFYLYGSLAPIIAKQFFIGDPTTTFIFALLAFAAGFIVRPFGALVFGRLGDMIGRKYTFLITILIMGASTFIVGLLPGHEQIGIAAPIILVSLRILQGLALGGEYGGAATYVAEHAPHGKRGSFTSWIQTTATLGLFLSLLVILGTRTAIGEKEFAAWGWRVPFLVSVLLLGVSVWIRLSMNESPAFAKMKAEGKTSKAPLSEAFGQWRNLKVVVLALIGLTMGQAVVWYTGQFYALFFMTQVLKIDGATSNILTAISLALATPFFIFFGKLSDSIGRKWIILGGCVIAAATYFPLFGALTHYGNPALETALKNSPVVVVADQTSCHFQFNLTGQKKFPSSCDIATSMLTQASVNYTTQEAPAGSVAKIKVGDKEITSFNATMTPDGLNFDKASKDAEAALKKEVAAAIKGAGYPAKADDTQINKPMMVVILFILVLYVTMVYGPIAAMLVEMFPTRIRYTSMSLPYHIGNGWFGGLLPTISFALVAFKGDIYYGLWYPIVIALITAVIGALFVRETKDNDIYAHD
ncbi:MFS transporter [Duganella sp. BJB488]|uniref:MFS transporter n=1 Tax=unclassified Duganella TaxID=2636909 RepID=UPI000E3537C6|nr:MULTISPECIES: MFS transporter [unclassified Duganella]NVD71711.1 MHS family MFS transporter [Duganella sp. BJB1802]RFP17596.1 MFS transporter [Duganella sp. BJB489]RFP22106.1 MFS transporter [Duganella sp. BJB488]RFP37440.1 MFS transporter [Duganella sp. BJB480]